jgi:cytochrome oxidase assembly protein ShyY1
MIASTPVTRKLGTTVIAGRTLVPKEAGIYIFHLDWYDTPAGRIDLAGVPLTVVDLRGPETIYSVASVAVSVVSLAVAIVALKKAQEAKSQKSSQLDGSTAAA